MKLRATITRFGAICVLALISIFIAPDSLADSQQDPTIRAYSVQDSVTVTGRTSYQVYSSSPGAPATGGHYAGGVFDEQAARTAQLMYIACVGIRSTTSVGTRNADFNPADCATDAAPTTTAPGTDGTPVVVTVSASDVITLLADGSGITRQPPGEEVLITKDFIVYTNPDTQVLSTTVAGTEVTIHATPVTYTWDWGDHTTTTTTTPGTPWPNQTVTHHYTHTAQQVATTLTTTWKATYTPTGGTTTPITGTITTTNTTTPYNIVRTLTYLTDQAETQQGH